jgi:hypothetical protein
LETLPPAGALAAEVGVGILAYAISVRVVARSATSELFARLRDALDTRRGSVRVARD